jgi:hypothetical protein
MSQITGSFAMEIDLDRLADKVADRVIARLRQAAQQAASDVNSSPAGSADYHRTPYQEPQPRYTLDSDPGGYQIGRRTNR